MQICLPDTQWSQINQNPIYIYLSYLSSYMEYSSRWGKIFKTVKKIKQGKGGKLEGTKSWRLNRWRLSVNRASVDQFGEGHTTTTPTGRHTQSLLLRQNWNLWHLLESSLPPTAGFSLTSFQSLSRPTLSEGSSHWLTLPEWRLSFRIVLYSLTRAHFMFLQSSGICCFVCSLSPCEIGSSTGQVFRAGLWSQQ